MTRRNVYVPLTGCGCLLWLFVLVVLGVMYAVIAAAWVLWACVILPAAGITWLAGRRSAARTLAGLVMWDLDWLRQ